jgi:two-component system, NarL family, nitrate/nitrite response regulator NarL
MQQTPQNSQRTSLEIGGRGSRDSSSQSEKEKTLKIVPNAEPELRVLISDRDSMSSDLLANALVRDGECAASAVRSANLLDALSTAKVDLVVIAADVDSESGSGFRLASAVCRAHPNIFLIILLDQTNHELVVNAFRSGARGVFSREHDMAEFLDCVDHVRRGFIWAGKRETSLLLDAFKSIPAPTLVTPLNTPALTARELQVVQCAATGKTNKTIANDLRLSEHTVKNYLFRAFDKLGISSRVELLFYLTVKGHTFNTANMDSDDSGLGIE